jgi:hypothetical protein
VGKQILIGMISIYLGLGTVLAATPVTIIKNAWGSTIKVKEGLFGAPATEVPAGQFLILDRPYNALFNLVIKYNNGISQWLKIPGCPEGNFFNALSVNITFNPSGMGAPLCVWNIIDI